MIKISIKRFKQVQEHPYLRAVAEVEIGGLLLRGLRLEAKSCAELTLGFPGRKVQGHWQVVYQAENSQLEQRILQHLKEHYKALGLAA